MIKIRKAFSLIETSVVLLIIAIVIVGITQSSRLINAFRLSSAKTTTESSPVTSIEGLSAWWETTMDESIDKNSADDDREVNIWNDINPNEGSKNHLIQNTSGAMPIYKSAVINGLPALKFSGSQYFETPYSLELNEDKFTIFAVVSPISYSTYGSIITSRDSPQKGYNLYVADTAGYEFWMGQGSYWSGIYENNAPLVLNRPSLLTAYYNSVSQILYQNGVEKLNKNLTTYVKNNDKPARVGAGATETTPQYFLNGYIGEIIIYNRALKAEERMSVEAYLNKKWIRQ